MQLNFSAYAFQTRTVGSKQSIYDIIRKKYVALTPEEWVRQHLVHYLIIEHKFPKSLISVEKKITLNGLTKRTDIVLFNRQANPVMLIECKAPEVKINQSVFDQAGRYNLVLHVPYLLVSNGNETICAFINHEKSDFRILTGLPSTIELLNE